jgi:hypothetical protein
MMIPSFVIADSIANNKFSVVLEFKSVLLSLETSISFSYMAGIHLFLCLRSEAENPALTGQSVHNDPPNKMAGRHSFVTYYLTTTEQNTCFVSIRS